MKNWFANFLRLWRNLPGPRRHYLEVVWSSTQVRNGSWSWNNNGHLQRNNDRQERSHFYSAYAGTVPLLQRVEGGLGWEISYQFTHSSSAISPLSSCWREVSKSTQLAREETYIWRSLQLDWQLCNAFVDQIVASRETSVWSRRCAEQIDHSRRDMSPSSTWNSS